jgi:hypothetical protein
MRPHGIGKERDRTFLPVDEVGTGQMTPVYPRVWTGKRYMLVKKMVNAFVLNQSVGISHGVHWRSGVIERPMAILSGQHALRLFVIAPPLLATGPWII